MPDAVATEESMAVERKGIWGWMFFDWATQPFHTLILTFIFAPYFANFVAENSVTGQAQWGYAVAAAGLIIAVMAPVLGAISDATGPRKPWILGFALLAAGGSFALWWAVPNTFADGSVFFVLLAFVVATFGFEFAAVFNNAM
ncbi:MAG: MFS transporter, partial [Pseudomonadota bacterium]